MHYFLLIYFWNFQRKINQIYRNARFPINARFPLNIILVFPKKNEPNLQCTISYKYKIFFRYISRYVNTRFHIKARFPWNIFLEFSKKNELNLLKCKIVYKCKIFFEYIFVISKKNEANLQFKLYREINAFFTDLITFFDHSFWPQILITQTS